MASDRAVDVRLRPKCDDDGEFLARLYASTRAEEMALVDWSQQEKNAFLAMQFTAQTHHYDEHYPGAEFMVIEQRGTPIGRLYLDRRADEIRIVDIALMPECRRSGIGGRLLKMVLDEAAATNRVVRIHVERNNPALGLYRRLGFVEMDDSGVYLLMECEPGRPEERAKAPSRTATPTDRRGAAARDS